ncbi:CASP-like protein 1D1 [Ananas comosus]|uniref:CASP-like protein n=1 Tax=Ananas comosus TaxID=4615 RepID=A0A6P5G0J2_ANACO|nr:CASP-like protein 1D1 [Ananas comosus]
MNTTTNYDKTAPESGGGAAPSTLPPNFFRLDLILRLFVFASTVSALVVLVTSKDTETIATGFPPPFASVTRDAKFNYSPAVIYLLVALAVAILYSIITIIGSCSLASRPAPSTKILFNLIVFDTLMAGILASATGSVGSVAYLGLRGNTHTNWNKVCNVFGKFCKHIGSSTVVTLAATIGLILLVVLSSYSLYRRSR